MPAIIPVFVVALVVCLIIFLPKRTVGGNIVRVEFWSVFWPVVAAVLVCGIVCDVLLVLFRR